MRQNLPVTQREFDFPEHATLLSTTDVHSHVAYANEAFLAVSGFTAEEIMGQPHNLVRHPDMPQQAFADMWATLKAGTSWTALVKNRRKDGDHYWVRANATPVMREGRLVGYMSVRTKPTRDEVQTCEALYARFVRGEQGSRAFHKGLIVRTGLARLLSWRQTASLRSRLVQPMALLWLLVSAMAALLQTWDQALITSAKLAGVLALTAWWLDGQVVRPLQRVLRQAQAVAAGSPGSNEQLDRVDEIGMLMRNVNQAGLNLRALLDDVSAQIDGLTGVSQEITQGNRQLSDRTEQAASSLEETAASMEQMTSSVTSTSQTAEQASALAEKASQAATQGGQVVGDVVRTMDEISGSARRITDIISVIDGIAFQTNILALNAAVEAARAGEQGRGFAVVAGEVRSLAQRSAEAAKEIKTLITDSTERVEQGQHLTAQAGRAMESIQCEAQSVTRMIADISRSAKEQSVGIVQVGAAVIQLDQMTQQNAAMVVNNSRASEALGSRAERLQQAVSAFR
jgi:aerotaxis receptor